MRPAHQPHRGRRASSAFTRVELLIVLLALALMVSLWSSYRARPRHRREGPTCINNLKQVGLSFRVFANDNGDKFPMQLSVTNGGTLELVSTASAFQHFQVMSKELASPRILACPDDPGRTRADFFTNGFSNLNVSYFVGLDARPERAEHILSGDRNLTVGGRPVGTGLVSLSTNQPLGWTSAIHKNAGNLLFADGGVNRANVVRQVKAAELQKAFIQTGLATNRLAMP